MKILISRNQNEILEENIMTLEESPSQVGTSGTIDEHSIVGKNKKGSKPILPKIWKSSNIIYAFKIQSTSS